jgi:hypothetical protein
MERSDTRAVCGAVLTLTGEQNGLIVSLDLRGLVLTLK